MSTLGGLLWRVGFWLPVCFGAWYFFSILFTAPLAMAVDPVLTLLFPQVIERVAQHGNALVALTRLVGTSQEAGATGEILFEVNPLQYSYCMPFYTALVLVAPGEEEWTHVKRWLWGMLVLFGVQIFGVSTEILKILAFGAGVEAQELLGFSAWGYEFLALAYQLGFLVLPPVVPVMLWFGQFQDAWEAIIGRASPSP